MTNEFPKFLPIALGLACGVLVWAIICLRERRRKK